LSRVGIIRSFFY